MITIRISPLIGLILRAFFGAHTSARAIIKVTYTLVASCITTLWSKIRCTGKIKVWWHAGGMSSTECSCFAPKNAVLEKKINKIGTKKMQLNLLKCKFQQRFGINTLNNLTNEVSDTFPPAHISTPTPKSFPPGHFSPRRFTPRQFPPWSFPSSHFPHPTRNQESV